jgi:hypothetical protein
MRTETRANRKDSHRRVSQHWEGDAGQGHIAANRTAEETNQHEMMVPMRAQQTNTHMEFEVLSTGKLMLVKAELLLIELQKKQINKK